MHADPLRALRPRLVAVLLLASLPGLVNTTGDVAGATAPDVVFTPSGLDGAGFQNVVAVDPRETGLVLAGGDVSGIHRSTDWGRTWRTSNLGITSGPMTKVAALAFSPSSPDTVYAAAGNQGAGGGLLVSTDAGRTWQLRSSVPQFSGGNNTAFAGLPRPHPRSTGNLLAVDDAGGYLYAATFRDGVMRSGDGGRTWTTLGLAGRYLRSLALDPADSRIVYAAAYGEGVFKTTTARGTGSFTHLAASPTSVEELVVLDGRLYAVAGAAGLFTSSDGGATWARLGAGAVGDDGPVWMALDAHVDPGNGHHVLVVGSDNPAPAGTGNHHSLLRSPDGGLSWAPLTADPSRIHATAGGPDGPTWWLSQTQPRFMLGQRLYTAAHVAVAGPDRSRIFVAGRSGVWATSDAGAAWYPMVEGLAVTINRAVVADPNVPGRVFVANTDWAVLSSDDGLRTVAQTRPPGAGTGYALALDTSATPAVVYAASGDRDSNTSGEIFSSADPRQGWTSEGLAAATGGKRPLGVAVRRVGGHPVVLAAVDGGGIWRKAAGSWKKVNSSAMGPQTTKTASFSWLPASAAVYLYDRQTGVWRSHDNGAGWVRIWHKPSAREMTGYLAADPTDPSRLYVSAADGLYRLDGAASGTVGNGVTATPIGAMGAPGPIAVDADGRLYVARRVTGSAPAALMVSPDRGATWSTVAGSGFYEGSALFPFDLAVGAGGSLYVSLNGNGVIAGRPAGTREDTTPPALTVAVPARDQVFRARRVSISGAATDDRGVAAVRVAIRDNATMRWLRADGTWGAWQQHHATLAAPGATSTSWAFTFRAPRNSTYGLQVDALDAAGNRAGPVWVRFRVWP